MHEWLEALRKSAKAAATGVSADEVRWAETECGVPFPEDLGHLYLAFNGGEFLGDVTLFPLHGPEGSASVLEKTRLKLEGLPAAGVWRIGVKGAHRHLFSARKSAMVEQGDGGGPLPGWVEALGDDEWVFGTWDGEKREMRLYRSLRDMLDVLVPPEEVESFGERTFARAMNAVLQGALSGMAAEEEEQAAEEEEVEEAEEEQEAQRELAYEYDEDVSRARKGGGADRSGGDETSGFGRIGGKAGGGKKPIARAEPSKVKQTELFVRPTMQEAVSKELGLEKKAEKKKAPVARGSEPKASAEPVEKKAQPVEVPSAGPKAKKAGKGRVGAVTLAEVAATKEPAPSVVAPTVVSEVATKKAAKPKAADKVSAAAKAAPAKAAEPKPTTQKAAPAKAVKKKAAAKKPPVEATKKAPSKVAAKKAPAKKAVAKKGAAKKPVAKKAVAKKGAAKKPVAKKAVAKKGAAKKPLAKKVVAKKGAAKKPVAKKAVSKKGAAKKPKSKK
ncbi:SMI1/KNR4 family protein [Myxococcus stipitatus]|uniref:SMI1/KNR4 family protein n=1 Tax=Myxococcus stipitatus TaxID=83455 RepID=UPI0030D2A82B